MGAEIDVFPTPTLGDNSYLVAVGADALLVDPQRDAWRFVAAADARGLSIRYVVETHVHNDYVSGALEVRAATGAQVIASAEGQYRFPHRGVAEGDEIHLDGVTVRAIETPGHTPEHLSYLLFDDGREAPAAAFTGGSLILGSAGRTDLLGEDRAEELTRAQFRSLRRLAALPDDARVLPTHGAGSFCASGSPSTGPTSTVGEELRHNPALREIDEERFIRDRLSGLLLYPAYYRHMAAANREGPAVLGRLPGLTPLGAGDLARCAEDGALVVDGRDRLSFAAAHIPGSINVELDDSFASYVGWVVPFDTPIGLILPEPVGQSAIEALTQLLRIGYDRVEGYLAGGVEAWRSMGYPVRTYPVADVDELCREVATDGHPFVLDVRQPREWEQGSIPRSLQVFVGDLPGRMAEIPRDRELWTICASGRRAAIAASLLDREGIPVKLVAREGVGRWLARCR